MLFRSPKILRWLYPKRIWGISVSDKTVFLTFDDGPDAEITPWVLDFLDEHQLKATFFCVGSNVRREPEIYKRILDSGHAVGNHSMNHENGFKTKNKLYLKSIDEASAYINSTLFRPPYGRMRRIITPKIAQKYKIVMWSWLSYDYDRSIPIEEITQSSKKIKSGDILVFHDNKKTKERLKELLPKVIEELKQANFKFDLI